MSRDRDGRQIRFCYVAGFLCNRDADGEIKREAAVTVEEITIDLTAVRLLSEVEDWIYFGDCKFPKLREVKIFGVESKALNGIAFPMGCKVGGNNEGR